MLDPLLNFVTAEPLTALGISVAAWVTSLWLGWRARSIGMRRREAEFKQAILDAKGSIPRFESSVRSREQQIGNLQMEIKSLKQHADTLEQNLKQRETELRSQSREIRTLTTELNVAKRTDNTDSLVLDGMDFDDQSSDGADATLRARVERAETLYANLRETLAEREERIAELETRLTSPSPDAPAAVSTAYPSQGVNQRALEDRISAQEATIERLERQLSDMRQDRDMLSGLVRSRAKIADTQAADPAELQASIANLEQELNFKEEVLHNREATMKRLLDELEQISRDRKEQQSEISRLHTEIRDQDDNITALRNDLDASSRELSTLRLLPAQLEQAPQSTRDTQATLTQSESWLEKFKASAARRSEELACVTAERDALKAQLGTK